MARSGLALRLGRIREQQKTRATQDTLTAQDTSIPEIKPIPEGQPIAPVGLEASNVAKQTDAPVPLPGWKSTDKMIHERITRISFPEYRDGFSEHFPLLFPRERESLSQVISSRDLITSFVFFDLETTGLSHGAGTVAFMAGIARIVFSGRGANKKANLDVHQILLDDYPGELAFLNWFSELVGDNPVFVSFNGKSFDSQILYTRYLMNGLQPSFLKQPSIHLDLLYPARRIWKAKLGSCRLSVIEEMVLGTKRIDDLPGSEAPDAWFDFVRKGEQDRLLAIGDHNRDDCASLVRLLYSLDDSIEKGTERASMIRAFDLRSRGEYAESRAFLEPLVAQGDRLALKLLAIDTEHRIDDLDRALDCARELEDEKRIIRLEKKISLRNAASAQGSLDD